MLGAEEGRVGRVRAVRRERLDHDPEAAGPRRGRETAQGLGEDGVAGDLLGRLAQDQGEDVAAAAGQLAGRRMRVVAEPLGGVEDARRASSSGILTSVRPLSTNDTVVRDTPASVATSALVGRFGIVGSAPPP